MVKRIYRNSYMNKKRLKVIHKRNRSKKNKKKQKYDTEITPEVLAQIRAISSKCVHTVKFDSDRKPSFPGYKANYWI